MVEIPKFYYKVVNDDVNNKVQFWVSEFAVSGYEIHPAFIRNGVEKSKIYISAYEGSIYDVSAGAYLVNDEQVADFTSGTGDKLSSIANVKPASGVTQALTIVNSRTLAHNRGTGWEQQDFLTVSAIQMLMIVEYGTLNSQEAIGLGVVNKDSGTGNESELTGQTSTSLKKVR